MGTDIMNPPTIRDAVDFALSYRHHGKHKVFDGWSAEQIAKAMQDAIKQNGFAYATDEQGAIAAVVLAVPDNANRRLRVKYILGKPGALQALLRGFKQFYSGYTICARRRGKEVVYPGNRLLKALKL